MSYVYWAITGQYSIINHPITGFVNTSRFTTLIFNLSGYNNDCAEYEITIDPQSFFDQNTGLPNQTCNHSAICVDQFLVEVHFNTLKWCIGTCARSGRPISTPNGWPNFTLFGHYVLGMWKKVILYITVSARYTYLYSCYKTIKVKI